MKPIPALPTARTSAAIIAMVALALLAAACGGRPSATASSGSANTGGAATSRMVAFSQCMRSHHVPGYPDPSNGVLPKESAQHLGVSSAQYQAAQRTCQHLLPTTGGSLTASSLQQCYLADVCPQSLVQHAVSAGLKFARCMRSHGVPNWPDPTVDSQGRPVYNINVPRPTPRRDSIAMGECERLQHAGSLLAWG